MTDSCRPRKLEPGLEQTYSIPSDLMTSTIKSEPERVSVRTSSFAGVPISASAGRGGGGALRASICWARDAMGLAANAAAPTAALLRNARRSIEALGEPFLDLHTITPPNWPQMRLYHRLEIADTGSGCRSRRESPGVWKAAKAQLHLSRKAHRVG